MVDLDFQGLQKKHLQKPPDPYPPKLVGSKAFEL